MATDNSILYRMMDDNCEQCGKPIMSEGVSLWIAPLDDLEHEKLAVFCDEACIDLWWEDPMFGYVGK